MDQNLTAEETMQLESKLRVVTARFELQRRDDALSAARTAVINDRISMVTLCGDIAQARLLEEPTQQGWRPL